MNRREKRQMIKLISRQLELFYKIAKEICREWEVNTLPLNTFDELIDKFKAKDNLKEESIQNWNLVMDSFKDDVAKIAAKMGSNKIPLSKLKEGLSAIKNGYIEGLNPKK